MATGEDQYLTLITAPPDHSRRRLAEALQSEAELDARTLEMILGRTPPCILGRFPAARCAAAILAITSRRGDAFACTLADIEALGPTHKIRDLQHRHGALIATLWRGGALPIEPKSIQVLVRAQLATSEVKPPPVQSPLASAPRSTYGHNAALAGYAVGGAYGLAVGMYGEFSAAALNWEKTITTSDKLDIHLGDGRVFQVDGDKFGYRILGDSRGLSDNVNISRMCELMTHFAPDAIVDPYFSLWKSPPGAGRLRLPMMKVNNDDPEFAFYSRWAALMYRHVMAG